MRRFFRTLNLILILYFLFSYFSKTVLAQPGSSCGCNNDCTYQGPPYCDGATGYSNYEYYAVCSGDGVCKSGTGTCGPDISYQPKTHYTSCLCGCTNGSCDPCITPTDTPGPLSPTPGGPLSPTPTNGTPPPDPCPGGFQCTNGGTCCRFAPDTPSSCTCAPAACDFTCTSASKCQMEQDYNQPAANNNCCNKAGKTDGCSDPVCCKVLWTISPCNETWVDMQVISQNACTNDNVVFSIAYINGSQKTGDVSYSDDFGNGVDKNTITSLPIPQRPYEWFRKNGTALGSGTYTWTHNWVSSTTSQQSQNCSKSITYTINPPQALSCPTGRSGSSSYRISDGKYDVNLSWNAAMCANTYDIYRCLGVGCSPVLKLFPDIPGFSTSYTDTTGMNFGDIAIYDIRPKYNGNSVSGCNVQVNMPTCPSCPCNHSVISQPLPPTSDHFQNVITWATDPLAQSYRIYRCMLTLTMNTEQLCTSNLAWSYVDTVNPPSGSTDFSLKPSQDYTDNNKGSGFIAFQSMLYEIRPTRTNCSVSRCP